MNFRKLEIQTFNRLNDCKTFCKCSNKECKFSVSKEICKKKLTDKNIKDLLSGKSISVSKLISKKTGKEFSACLKLDENGKITFSFDNVPKTAKKSQPKKKTSKN